MVNGNRCLIFIFMMSCRILICIAFLLPCLAPAQTDPAAQPERTSLPSHSGQPGPPDQPSHLSIAFHDQPGSLPIFAGGRQAVIYTDTADAKVVSLTTAALADDIACITGKRLPIRHSSEPADDYIIIIGTLGRSRLLDSLLAKSSPRTAALLSKSLPTATSPLMPATGASPQPRPAASSSISRLAGKWESYQLTLIDRPFPNVKKALVIAGSDPRGTAYGIFELSRLLGVSPWKWWADAHPATRSSLYIRPGRPITATPSVRYRGIFLNDEDWGLQPWAATTFEPETGDIGPKTYARIFELLLRLKANLIWPAMHPCTKAFYSYPGNVQMAADYAIIIGSSHAEPMLRNNVGEWNTKAMGDFNYLTNKANVYKYWEERVRQSKGSEAIYTVGMRGVHDGAIEGVKTPEEAVPLLERIIADQRDLLRANIDDTVSAIPQAFTAYKEVLDIYDHNLQLPGDITLVWPDDNYGYIQRLSNEEENHRPGGSGVYYHASYWGRPHDYLWLSSTHPSLIREEMMKAYENGSDRLWVLNVGDIRPLELNIQLFLDMAFDTRPFRDSRYIQQYLSQWCSNIFGPKTAAAIVPVLWEYDQLAFERRPEFMGWSQTEPTTATNYTAYNHFFYGDEAQRRIDRYNALEQRVKQLAHTIEPRLRSAYYELVYYPVVCASLMNKKFLYRDKAALYARQNRISSFDYAQLSREAFNAIRAATQYYNDTLENGKWKNMMSMQPRDLPVFKEPILPDLRIDSTETWDIVPEGYAARGTTLPDASTSSHAGTPSLPPPSSDSLSGSRPATLSNSPAPPLALPVFTPWGPRQYFIDLFLCRHQALDWTATPSSGWISLSRLQGRLSPGSGNDQIRIWVSVNKSVLLQYPQFPQHPLSGWVVFNAGGRQLKVRVSAGPIISPSTGASTSQPTDLSTGLSTGISTAQFPGTPTGTSLPRYGDFAETNGYLSIFAADYSRKVDKPGYRWEILDGLGRPGRSLQATADHTTTVSTTTSPSNLADPSSTTDTTQSGSIGRAYTEYNFYTFTSARPTLTIASLPTQPLNNTSGMRYAVAIDNGPVTIVDFHTTGRSEEWKQNVLSNAAEKKINLPFLDKGRHTLKIYMIDPGVILDHLLIDLGGLKKAYGLIPETKYIH